MTSLKETMRVASSVGDRPVQAKCLVCLGDIQRSQKNNEVGRESSRSTVLYNESIPGVLFYLNYSSSLFSIESSSLVKNMKQQFQCYKK